MKTKNLIEVMQAQGAANYPAESCGLVVKKGRKSIIVPCRNMSATPRYHFLMNIEDYIAASDMGEVVGVWHTHIELPSRPSDTDRVGCENSGVPWYIMGVRKVGERFAFEELEILEPAGFEMPYLERPYVYGVLDCWTLVRDFYRREFGVELIDMPRVENYWRVSDSYFADEQKWVEMGFENLIDQEPQPGDIFLLQTDDGGRPNHCAIYIGDNMILHHCVGRLSRRDIYGGYWHKHTTKHKRLRNKS